MMCTHSSIPTLVKAPTSEQCKRLFAKCHSIRKSLPSPAQMGKVIMDNHKKNSTGGYISTRDWKNTQSSPTNTEWRHVQQTKRWKTKNGAKNVQKAPRKDC